MNTTTKHHNKKIKKEKQDGRQYFDDRQSLPCNLCNRKKIVEVTEGFRCSFCGNEID